jgi:uncharacterized protein YijF (DUF1287 family)
VSRRGCRASAGQVNPSALQSAATKRQELVEAAEAQVGVTTSYDPAYAKLAYPGGDVPEDRGVCTDVVIRALREVKVDLQQLVHEDKKKFPAAYAHDGASSLLDANIDHRRVPNLMVFFKREGKRGGLSARRHRGVAAALGPAACRTGREPRRARHGPPSRRAQHRRRREVRGRALRLHPDWPLPLVCGLG